MRNTRAITALALLASGTFALAACSGSASSTASSAAGHGAAAVAQAPSAASAAGGQAARKSAGGTNAGGTGTTARVSAGSAIVYTAWLTVRVPQVTDGTTAAAQVAEAAGGYVAQEASSSDSGASASIELKIPVSGYPAALARLAGLGTRLKLNQQAQDVTEQVADVNSQVTSDQAAIAQLRTLLSHAGSVGDLLTVQNQINSEESDLETIEAQQRALGGETSYATVNMTIVGPKATPAVKHAKPKPPPSLAAGLTGGWRALRITADWVLAILGALAPFLALAALAAFGTLRTRRWILRRRAA